MNRYPIILVEGLDGVGKTTLTRALARDLGAELVVSPPPLEDDPVLGGLRSHFDARPPEVRRAFYRFANLLASEQARLLCQHRPVVLDRYWPSTVAFGVAVDGSDELMAWAGNYPSELVRPDVMILLEVDEATRARRIGNRGEPTTIEEGVLASAAETRARVTRVYRTFEPIVIDTSSLDESGVLRAVKEVIGRVQPRAQGWPASTP